MKIIKTVLLVFILSALATVGWTVYQRVAEREQAGGKSARSSTPAAVAVAPITIQPMTRLRRFTGSLDANAEFLVAPKVGGRIEEVLFDLGDAVERDQVVARIDNAEYVQELNRVGAELAVARANLAESVSQLEIAEREQERITTLRKRGVSSESENDSARATFLARKAHVEVARAQVQRAEAELETARIRMNYSDVRANWRGGGDERVVAERFVDEGETVTANQPLLKMVGLDPLIGVLSVTERDYGQLSIGQMVNLGTDAFPGELFTGRVSRISPVFDEATRQARVEVSIENRGYRLNPGMFIRVDVSLERVDEAVTVPELALVTRENNSGVFLLDGAGESVSWVEVEPGIREDGRVQLVDAVIDGSVVILGQQLLDHGSRVIVTRNTSE